MKSAQSVLKIQILKRGRMPTKSQKAAKLLLTIDKRYGVSPQKFMYGFTTGRLPAKLELDVMKYLGVSPKEVDSVLYSGRDIANSLLRTAKKGELERKGWISKRTFASHYEKDLKRLIVKY